MKILIISLLLLAVVVVIISLILSGKSSLPGFKQSIRKTYNYCRNGVVNMVSYVKKRFTLELEWLTPKVAWHLWSGTLTGLAYLCYSLIQEHLVGEPESREAILAISISTYVVGLVLGYILFLKWPLFKPENGRAWQECPESTGCRITLGGDEDSPVVRYVGGTTRKHLIVLPDGDVAGTRHTPRALAEALKFSICEDIEPTMVTGFILPPARLAPFTYPKFIDVKIKRGSDGFVESYEQIITEVTTLGVPLRQSIIFVVESAETKTAKLPVSTIILVDFAVTNTELFSRIPNKRAKLESTLGALFRDYAATRTLNQVFETNYEREKNNPKAKKDALEDKSKKKKSSLEVNPIKEFRNRLVSNREDFGFMPFDFDVKEIWPVGETKALFKAMQKAESATREGKVIEKIAKAEKQRLTLEGEGKAAALRAEYGEMEKIFEDIFTKHSIKSSADKRDIIKALAYQKSNISTLVESGGNAKPAVSVNS